MQPIISFALLCIPLALQALGVFLIFLFDYTLNSLLSTALLICILCYHVIRPMPAFRLWYAAQAYNMMRSIASVEFTTNSSCSNQVDESQHSSLTPSHIFAVVKSPRSSFPLSVNFVFPIFAYIPQLFPHLFQHEQSVHVFHCIYQPMICGFPFVRYFTEWIGVQSYHSNPYESLKDAHIGRHVMMVISSVHDANELIKLACIKNLIVQPIVVEQQTSSIASVLTQASFPTLKLQLCATVDCRSSKLPWNVLMASKKKEWKQAVIV